MSTFVLVHGGFHGGWCWTRVADRLRSGGHTVFTPTLTGLGERRHLVGPNVDLATHVQDVVNVLLYEELSDVILVGHSYGGMVVSGVAGTVPNQVSHIVYLDALPAIAGESMEDLAPVPMAANRTKAVQSGIPWLVPIQPGEARFFGVDDPVDLAWLERRLTPQPLATLTQPLVLADPVAASGIPCSAVRCMPPLVPDLPSRSVERLEAIRQGGQLFEIDSGHDCMVTVPDTVAQILETIAESIRTRPVAPPDS